MGKRQEPIRKVTANGRIRYRVVIDAGKSDNGKRRQVCSTWETHAEARAEVARVRTQIQTGTLVSRQKLPVSDYLESWLAGRHNVKPKTVEGYRNALAPLTTRFGSKPIQELTKNDLDRLVVQMLTEGGRGGKGRSPRTVALMLTILQSALQDAVEQKFVTQNVAAQIDKPRAQTSEPLNAGMAWDPAEARQFLKHVENDRLSAAWRLSLYGLRRGEILGLKWEHVNLGRGLIEISETRLVAKGQVITSGTKNRNSRIVPIGGEVVADLRELKTLQVREKMQAGVAYMNTGLVVVDELGLPMYPDTYSKLFLRHTEAANLPRIRLHDLRHTAASLMAANGVPIITAAALLGHDPLVYAKVYAHHYSDELRTASNLLSSIYNQAM